MGGTLFLEGSYEEKKLYVNIETATCLSLVSYLSSPLKISIVPASSPVQLLFKPPSTVQFNLVREPPLPARLCALPVFSCKDDIYCVSGLSSVLRQICKQSGEKGKELLGFRNSCLAAPSETSPFVWFCEVAVCSETSYALERLEHHLSLPVRVHNAGKYKSILTENGRFVEGPHFLLTDVVLAVTIDIILQRMDKDILDRYPHINKWLERVKNEKNLNQILSLTEICQSETTKEVTKTTTKPLSSLYKRDPTRYKPRHKIFTQQCEIDSNLEVLAGVEMMEVHRTDPAPLPDFVPLPDVPSERKERKSQQIQCFISTVLQIIHEGDTVVDFCAGSGHVGLAVAACLPTSCRVILLDNKEGSLSRAKERIVELGLENVWLIQANLGYFTGDFQVGMALHACGVASDLVLQKCIDKGASLVLCPCCYGAIQTNDKVSYPQSDKFRNAGLSERGYIVLGHSADQPGEQGEKSMRAVDSDRCYVAIENGYKVRLSKMEPLTCSTRNNLIQAVKQ